MFDVKHTLFILFSFFALTISFILCKKHIKTPKTKDIILKISAIVTVILHYSPLYVDYFSTGHAEVSNAMLLPLYPCHLAMLLLTIVAFTNNKESKFFKTLSIITFYLGFLGGVIGLVFNLDYAYNPTFADWDILNGLIGHVTLLFGCTYLLVGEYIQIRVSNMFSILIGELLIIINGCFVNILFDIFNIPSVNSMFLLYPPFESAPWFNAYVIGIFSTIFLFTFTAIYEQITLPKQDRWYTKLKEWWHSHKTIKHTK